MSEIKKQLEDVLFICSKCEIRGRNGEFCRDIPISEKICSGFGCGKWKKDGRFILNQKFYDEIRKRVKIKQVIDDLIKK